MTKAVIESALDEAKEFIRRAETVLRLHAGAKYSLDGSPETAALRRQSMELTRALAMMRRPN